jgi:uncharacterized protein YggU (UPF0235/DUF167 family)
VSSDGAVPVLRVTVRVQPGASRSKVGGRYGDAVPPVLVAKVSAPPIDGRANEAVREALAEAFGVRTTAVTLVAGHSSRLKVLDVRGAEPDRLEQLLRR